MWFACFGGMITFSGFGGGGKYAGLRPGHGNVQVSCDPVSVTLD